MFDKAKLVILKKLLAAAYPERDFNVEKIGNAFIFSNNDSVGCNDFLLKEKYTYDQVVELNNLTGYSAGFGYCKELGPVAFIGVSDQDCVQKSGYFEHEVQAYGESINDDEYFFSAYSLEEAKQIGNYTVYGMGNPRILNGAALIEKVRYNYDYRYKIRNEGLGNIGLQGTDVLEMQIKVGGTYDFYEARKFAYGSTGKFDGASGEDRPIQFAIAGGKPVGIIDLWLHYDNIKFKDVWGYGEDEPEEQEIQFLTDEEAKKINNFKLYYFIAPHSFGTKKFETEKIDRTLSKDFDFIMEDGTDYRLQNIPEKETKVKVLVNQSNNM